MSQINIIGLMSMAALLTVFGCGDPNSQVSFDPDTGQHIAGWYPLGHKNAASGTTSSCIECHGSDFSGGISGVACESCHILAGNFSCSACHAYPPTAVAHPAHAFPRVSCVDCHSDTIGTSRHTDTTDYISLSVTYNAKSGPASFTGGATDTCLKVSCHGGQTTPSWPLGTIAVNTQCTSCHARGTTEYNSFNSGQHGRSEHLSKLCTDCHDTTKLAVNHFSYLNTPAMEGPASATIRDAVLYNGSSCNPEAGGITTGCHGSEDWD